MKKKHLIIPAAVIGAISVIALGIFLLLFIIPQKIVVQPTVFDVGGDNYTIIFQTSLKGSGYVKYTVDGEEKIVWDTTSGSISTHDDIHSISVPKNELRNNTYVVGSQFVAYKLGYSAIKGRSVESDPISFRGEEKEDNINILAITDVHNKQKEMMEAASFFTQEFDMVVMLGDIVSDFGNKSRFTDHVLTDAATLSKGEIPVVYARGNHETRGEYASQMLKYFRTESGELYYTFKFGALSAIVLDTGEDKEDSHKEYSGLVDFASYREKQYSWIESLDAEDFDGRYKIVFSHMPSIDDHFGKNWMTPLKNLGAQLIVGGHHHRSEIFEKEILAFDACGKYSEGWAASSLTLTNDLIMMKTINTEGEVLLDKYLNVWEANHRDEATESPTEENSSEAQTEALAE